jgi:hypothetical protein
VSISKLTKEWLQNVISGLEDLRDPMLAFLDDDQAKTYEAMKLALAVLDGKTVSDNTQKELERLRAQEPVVYIFKHPSGKLFWSVTSDDNAGATGVIPVYAEPKPLAVCDRENVRRAHAEWSDATFGDVGPVGPLKHLSKEALEAAADPSDPLEWADMQFLLWDAQRRMGISDEFITRAMMEKLAINKTRQWPEPKDGEPRLHIKSQSESDEVTEPKPLAVPVEQDEIINAIIRAIQKEQDRLFDEDYLMDSKDCIDVIREESVRMNAWLSEVANFRGHAAGYRAMLDAVPTAPEVRPDNQQYHFERCRSCTEGARGGCGNCAYLKK